MDNSTIKTNFRRNKIGIVSRIKEKVVNELNLIMISLILSIAITIAVCIPVKDFIFKENSSIYGVVYDGLIALQHQLVPICTIAISSFLVGYIFNKDYIKKLYYINKHERKNTLNSSKYIFRIIVLFIAFILSSSILGKKIIPQIVSDENTIKYLYNNSIIFGVLLSALSSYIVFFGVNRRHSQVLFDRMMREKYQKEEELKNQYSFKYKNLNKKYLNLFNDLIKTKVFTYNDYNFTDLLNSSTSDKQYGISLEKYGTKLQYSRTQEFIEFYTNEGKYFSSSNQIKNIKSRYGSHEVDHLRTYFSDLLDSTLCTQGLHFISCIEKNYPNSLKNKDFHSYIKKLENYLTDLVKVNYDINEYLNNRIKYLDDVQKISELGYKGEQRVKSELNKYRDHFISIENKCFNFKYIDFIQENYTMECDNILVTQRGIFIIETKNNGENSVYVDKATGKTYSKYVLHIESDGRWVFKDNNGGFKVLDKTPVEQNRDHIIKLEKIINHHLGYDRFDNNYLEVKSIIVMANKNIKIENDLGGVIDVCRPESIYETIMKYPKNPFFTREMIKKIVEIIESYDETIHKPKLYDLINVERELRSLESMLNSTIVNKSYCHKVNDTLRSYYMDLENLNKEYLKEVNNI